MPAGTSTASIAALRGQSFASKQLQWLGWGWEWACWRGASEGHSSPASNEGCLALALSLSRTSRAPPKPFQPHPARWDDSRGRVLFRSSRRGTLSPVFVGATGPCARAEIFALSASAPPARHLPSLTLFPHSSPISPLHPHSSVRVEAKKTKAGTKKAAPAKRAASKGIEWYGECRCSSAALLRAACEAGEEGGAPQTVAASRGTHKAPARKSIPLPVPPPPPAHHHGLPAAVGALTSCTALHSYPFCLTHTAHFRRAHFIIQNPPTLKTPTTRRPRPPHLPGPVQRRHPRLPDRRVPR